MFCYCCFELSVILLLLEENVSIYYVLYIAHRRLYAANSIQQVVNNPQQLFSL